MDNKEQIPNLVPTNKVTFNLGDKVYMILIYQECLYRGVLYNDFISANISANGDFVPNKPEYITQLYTREQDALTVLMKYTRKYYEVS